jgi:hypothetical protein
MNDEWNVTQTRVFSHHICLSLLSRHVPFIILHERSQKSLNMPNYSTIASTSSSLMIMSSSPSSLISVPA